MSLFGRRELEAAALKYAAGRIRRSVIRQHELVHDCMHDAGVITAEELRAIVERRRATALASTVVPLAMLRLRLANTEPFSAEWAAVQNEIERHRAVGQ